jgi:hypothetical protein
MTDEHNKKQTVHYCAYLVAFFDILGQRDKMSRITLPPLIENEDTIDKFKQDVLRLHRNVQAFRNFFSKALNSFAQGGIENNEIPEQAKPLISKLREHPITYRTFADSVIVHIRLKGDEIQYAGRSMYGVLGAAAVTFNSCMAMGVPIRGGIDLGFAMNIGPDEIYGPALASAYHLENKVAAYPRIVVGHTLVSYLKKLSDSSPTTDTDIEKANHLLAKKSLNLMTVDDDGNMIVDHLGDYIRNILQEILVTADVVSKAYDFACSEYKKYRIVRNEAPSIGNGDALKRCALLADRYELLIKYFKKHLHSWGINDRS